MNRTTPQTFDLREFRKVDILSHLDAPKKRGRWSRNGYGDLVATWRHGAFRSIEYPEFRKRQLDFRVEKDNQCVAVAAFTEWKCAELAIGAYDFVNAADSDSQGDYEMADAIANGIEWDVSPFDFGSITSVETLHVRPRVVPVRRLWEVIATEIDRVLGSRGSLLVLQPYPLEFNGPDRHKPARPNSEAQKRRVRAMERHYGTMLGAQKMGPTGWMGLALGGYEVEFRAPDSERIFNLGDEWCDEPSYG